MGMHAISIKKVPVLCMSFDEFMCIFYLPDASSSSAAVVQASNPTRNSDPMMILMASLLVKLIIGSAENRNSGWLIPYWSFLGVWFDGRRWWNQITTKVKTIMEVRAKRATVTLWNVEKRSKVHGSKELFKKFTSSICADDSANRSELKKLTHENVPENSVPEAALI